MSGDGGLRFSWGCEDPDLLLATRRLRTEFVEGMGWRRYRPDELDQDDYDALPQTLHAASWADRADTPLVALRLTRCASVPAMLSVRMFGSDPGTQSTIIDELSHRPSTNLWDLTRLVHPLSEVSPALVLEAAVQLFGIGISATCEGTAEDPAWCFTTTPLMKDALNHLGIATKEVARSRLSPGDPTDSHFCVVDPLASLAFVRQRPEYGFSLVNAELGMGFYAASAPAPAR